MRNFKLTVAYDGTAYSGFQRQTDAKLSTIQSELENAWQRLTGETVKVTGAGRTDAGVHAYAQTVNIRSAMNNIPIPRIPLAINTILPEDIKVIGCEEVSLDFHSQHDAISKRYTYRIQNGPYPLPRYRHDTLFIHRPLDADAMHQAAQILVGRHDFKSFTRARQIKGSTVRTVFLCEVRRDGDLVLFSIEADGFLFHMVRTIAGTLLQIGEGSFEPGHMQYVIDGKDRSLAGKTLPGKGLVLEYVTYEL